MPCNGKASVVEILFHGFGGYNYVYSLILVYMLFFEEFVKSFQTSCSLFFVCFLLIMGSGGVLVKSIPIILMYIVGYVGVLGTVVFKMLQSHVEVSELQFQEIMVVVFTPFTMLSQIILAVLCIIEIWKFQNSQDKLIGTVSRKKQTLLETPEQSDTNVVNEKH